MAPVLSTVVGLLSIVRLGLTTHQCGWNPSSSSYLQSGLACPRPIDENVDDQPRSWAPWTNKPFCAKSKYCVFTSATVPRGHGISIITTPEIAAGPLNLLEHSFDLPHPDPAKVYEKPPFELREIPRKGLGLVATRRILRDTVIMIDHTIMIAPIEQRRKVTQAQMQQMFQRGVDQLPDPDKVLSLFRKGNAGVSQIEDILLSNTFGITVDGKSFMGLFPLVSRLNHECSPNAFTHFSEKTLAITVWSAQDIKPGEEITLSYTDVETTTEERQEMLLHTWGFECKCRLCTASPKVRAASDDRRKRIKSLQDDVLQRAERGQIRWAIDLSEELMKLAAEEGLTSHIEDFYVVPARLYYTIGNMERAEKYTRLALEDLQHYGEPGETGMMKINALNALLTNIAQKNMG